MLCVQFHYISYHFELNCYVQSISFPFMVHVNFLQQGGGSKKGSFGISGTDISMVINTRSAWFCILSDVL